MIDEILAATRADATILALREDGHTTELIVEPRAAATLVGGVRLGRVTRVAPAMGAAFVEIGEARAGFLPLPPRDSALALPHEGAAAIVQVTKDPQGGKGATLTLDVALPGRYLVLAPRRPGVTLSRRIGDAAARARLAQAMAAIARDGEGFILRTAAENAAPEELARDAEALRRLWAEIAARAAGAAPPAVLHDEPPPLVRLLRDRGHDGIARVVTDDAAAAEAARDYCRRALPALATRIATYREPIPLLDRFGVSHDIDEALARRVTLPSGGCLTIEPTAALVAVDVDTARHGAGGGAGQAATILAANLEAAREIVRQIRLRNLSGLIVIDFVRMADDMERERVAAALRDGLADDPVFARVAGFTRLGLLELSRRRARPPLHELLTADGRVRAAAGDDDDGRDR